MRDEILAIIQEEFEFDAPPDPTERLAELRVDSMAVVCAIQALEERFGIDIPLDVDFSRFETVGDIVGTVERIAAESGSGDGPGAGSDGSADGGGGAG